MRRHFVLAVLLLPVLALPARAMDAKVVKRLVDSNRVALEDIDLGDAEAAKTRLVAALKIAQQNGLEKHAVAAQTHFDLGLAYAALKTPDQAVAEFKTALEIDGTVTAPAKFLTPTVNGLLEKAKGVQAPPPPPPVDPNAPVSGIQHAPVDAAKEGEPVVIQAQVGTDVKAKQVNLVYKPAGAKAFTTVSMKKGKGLAWIAQIPAEVTGVDSIAYYIEAKNAKAKLAATKGSAPTPFVITILRKQKPQTVQEEEKVLDDENPLAKPKK